MFNNNKDFKQTDIGLIPKEWNVTKLGDLSNFQYGLGESAKNIGDYVYVRITDISTDGFLKKAGLMFIEKEKVNDNYFLNKGDVLVARTGASFGKTYLFNENFKATYGGFLIKYIFNKELLDNKFFFQFSRSSYYWEQANSLVGGGAQPQFNANTIGNLLVPCPLLKEQQRIAEILSSLDDKIELNQKINNNLEKIASTLFKKWFVDFEFPDKDGNPHKSSGGKMIDSELGKIPDGWKVGVVSDLVSVDSGFSFSSSIFNKDGKYGLVTIKNVQDGAFIRQCSNYIKNLPNKMPGHCKLKNGDILLSLTGNVGRICIVNGKNFLLNQRVAALNPHKEFNRAFTYFLFRQKDFQDILINISRGTAQQNLSPIETKNLEIIIPEEKILKSFGEMVNSIFLNLLSNLGEIENLISLRDSLLPKLMSGKIRTNYEK